MYFSFPLDGFQLVEPEKGLSGTNGSPETDRSNVFSRCA
jgi:hypothetical protein